MSARLPALALALIAAQPAEACHMFHVWRYPTPQRCSVAKAAARPLERVSAFVPDLPVPAGDPDPARALGLRLLRAAIEKDGQR